MSYLVLTLGDFVLGDIIIGDFVLWDFVQKCFCPRGLCPKGFCHGGFGPKPRPGIFEEYIPLYNSVKPLSSTNRVGLEHIHIHFPINDVAISCLGDRLAQCLTLINAH